MPKRVKAKYEGPSYKWFTLQKNSVFSIFKGPFGYNLFC